MKFYFAGKITKNGWRETILGYRGGSTKECESQFNNDWAEEQIPNTEHTYVGPYFISCDHGCFHGDGQHGAGIEYSDCNGGNGHDRGENRGSVAKRCLTALRKCDIVFAWLEPGAYGTVAEIGYAKALGKTVIVAYPDFPDGTPLASSVDVSDLWFAITIADAKIGVSTGAHGVKGLNGGVLTSPKEAFYNLIEVMDGPSLDKCQSPIEKSYLSAIMHKDLYGFRIKQQYEIDNGRYFLDFALLHSDGRKVCVECDGHDYHERTKEQAQRDRERDRFLALRDWYVLRFTGSEIYRDAEKCARETLEHLRKVSNGSR